jgi:preprotein translocase subunit SecG
MSERKSRNIFVVGYVVVLVLLVMMSSCGSSKEFHIGTGKELSKSRCTGNYIGG